MKKKYLITAALPYVNNIQHLGHMVGCHLPADIFCRFQKSRGNDAIFIGGSDDHGTAKELIDKLNVLNHKIYETMIGAKKYNNATNVVGMGFMNFEGQKFSKSKNVGIFCDGLFGSDFDIDGLQNTCSTTNFCSH